MRLSLVHVWLNGQTSQQVLYLMSLLVLELVWSHFVHLAITVLPGQGDLPRFDMVCGLLFVLFFSCIPVVNLLTTCPLGSLRNSVVVMDLLNSRCGVAAFDRLLCSAQVALQQCQ